MQKVKEKFINEVGTYGSLQSCIRTNDLDLVGDGTHLTYFQMIGNFSFNSVPYEQSIMMWHNILKDLEIYPDKITVNPQKDDHYNIFKKLGYKNIERNKDCVWTDSNIGGFCCEMFINDLEIGNLVNTLGHSTDVGFGLERLVQIVERKNSVHETSLFDQNLNSICKDLTRTLEVFYKNNINPGSKGRNSICRKILRMVLDDIPEYVNFKEWIESEKEIRNEKVKNSKKHFNKFKERSDNFFWETFGVIKTEISNL